MKKNKRNHKKYKFTYIKVTMFTLFFCLLFLRGYTPLVQAGENYFHVWVNGQEVGILGDCSQVEELLLKARRNVAAASDDLVFMEVEWNVEGEAVLWGQVDEEEDVLRRMEEAMKLGLRQTMHRAYTLKINEYTLNMASLEEVRQLLQAALDKYDSQGRFEVVLAYDTDREFSVLTTSVVPVSVVEEDTKGYLEAGIQLYFSGLTGEHQEETDETEKDFEDYELGILDMDFSEEVEVVEVYLPESQLTPLEEAINLVLMEQETPDIYEVVAGDTLTAIALKVNIPMDRIIEMNDILEDENTILHIGDQLLITVPEPELSVTRVEEKYYDEFYDAEVEYIDNNSWYTNKIVERQAPSTGFRRIIAQVTYVNDKEVSRTILKEEVVMEAVAKVIERGTVVPPTYIKPISGGTATSGFGPRKAPVPGASTYHKAQDWATPVGTSVYASSAGTVSRAGWGSGYGYVIYIDHEDGKQTRYAHLSKILVKVGQKVKQGEKIALSGNTGVTSGPHVHFEILVNGVQVDPLQYVPK